MEHCILTGIPDAIGSTGKLNGPVSSDLIIILMTDKESKDGISKNEIITHQILLKFNKNMIYSIPTAQHSILPHCSEDPLEKIVVVLGMSFHLAAVALLIHYESGLYLKPHCPMMCW